MTLPPSPPPHPPPLLCLALRAEPSAGDQHTKSAVRLKSINSRKPQRQPNLDSEGTTAANTHTDTFFLQYETIYRSLMSSGAVP